VLQVKKEARRVRAGAGKLGSACGGSDDGGAMWRGEEGASRGREAASAVLERHVARRRAARGQLGSEKWPVRAAGSGAERTERRGS
jgi:hypothetical protein